MNPHTIPAGQFKTRCLQLLDEVATTGEPLTITKRGRPVARLVPLVGGRPLFGALAGSATRLDDPTAPVGEPWAADR